MKSVVSALIRIGDQILVQSHNKHNMLTIPIGGVEEGETIYEAIKRELKEELGVTEMILHGHWVYPREELGVTEYMFTVTLISPWHNAEPEKHTWMAFKSIEEIHADTMLKSESLKSALEMSEVAK